jgi:hypothetical protein
VHDPAHGLVLATAAIGDLPFTGAVIWRDLTRRTVAEDLAGLERCRYARPYRHHTSVITGSQVSGNAAEPLDCASESGIVLLARLRFELHTT